MLLGGDHDGGGTTRERGIVVRYRPVAALSGHHNGILFDHADARFQSLAQAMNG